ncbi:DUF4393 domain-containing protein [Haemophilus haemolyticus]|uniref:DUF4393 domain-containing protein n=1 Tax=Haemophilus haemolyticus TaxID=726 RepID=UPI000E56E93A|nr:DUF4393 domain-containing protein [Haemophilus haemolyticus]
MNELYPIVSGALSGLAAVGALKGPIESLTQIWTLTLGRFSDDAYQKYKIKQAANLQKYANEVKSGIEKIPEENIQEPKMSVIGPALEASKFYIEEDEIRGMFAKLIASSMDNSKSADIHPSFSEMIKMLSPLDAQNLQTLYQSGDETISKIRMTYDGNGGFKDVYSHIYLGNPETQDNQLIAPSIDNLIRLKLIDIDYETFKNNDALYEKHRNNPLLLQYKQEDQENRQTNQEILNFLNSVGKRTNGDNIPIPEEVKASIKQQLEDALKPRTIDIVKGKISLTALGRNFCKICLSE